MKILILKPSSLGDVVQALPVLRLLKARWPHSEIHWWIASGLAPLLEDDPDLSGLIVFHRQRWQSPWRWAELVRSVREMRRRRFDLVIDLQGLARSGAVCWLANGAQSIGLGGSREGARGFYDIAVDRPAGRPHAADWYVHVLEQLRVPVHWNFDWLPRRPAIAADVRERWPMLGKRFLAVCPGARWLNKRWPLENFAAAIRLLGRQEPELHFAIVGGPEDLVLGRHLSGIEPGRCADLTGRTTLPELVEAVRLSAGMLTNDTGPMHIAAALGKPVTALFGPTAPEQTGPFGQMEGVLRNGSLRCAPCLKPVCRHTHELECLTSLAPGRVADAMLARIFSRTSE